jgi:hypothetical protein
MLSTVEALVTGALSSLRRDWGLGRLGADWAAGEGVLGLVQYSTYRERDYDAIWDRYAWVKPLTIWFERVRLSVCRWPQHHGCRASPGAAACTVSLSSQAWLLMHLTSFGSARRGQLDDRTCRTCGLPLTSHHKMTQDSCHTFYTGTELVFVQRLTLLELCVRQDIACDCAGLREDQRVALC